MRGKEELRPPPKKREGSEVKKEGKQTQNGVTGEWAIASQKMLIDGPYGTTATWE